MPWGRSPPGSREPFCLEAALSRSAPPQLPGEGGQGSCYTVLALPASPAPTSHCGRTEVTKSYSNGCNKHRQFIGAVGLCILANSARQTAEQP